MHYEKLKTTGIIMLAESDCSVELAHTDSNQLIVFCDEGPVFIDLQTLNEEIVATYKKKDPLNPLDIMGGFNDA